MLRTLRERMSSERGFTLIELLVVILIIGILAAIALPAFLGQRQKGQDAEIKSAVRNLVSHMESCFTNSETYVGCNTSSDVQNSGIPIGGNAGQVEITNVSATGYELVGHSRSGNTFRYIKNGSTVQRTCTNQGEGGCPSNGQW